MQAFDWHSVHLTDFSPSGACHAVVEAEDGNIVVVMQTPMPEGFESPHFEREEASDKWTVSDIWRRS